MHVATLDEYARLRGVLHCQTKMILGQHCGAPLELDRDDLQRAVDRLRSSRLWFGLTDRWSDSMRMLHCGFGGEVRAFELENLRPGWVKPTADSHEQARALLDDLGDMDLLLHREALAIFESEMVRWCKEA